jgi:cytochrome b6-f complex iron-sulfur subunit
LTEQGKPESDSDDSRPSGGVDRRRLLQLLLSGSTVAVGGLIGVPVASYLRPLEEAEGAAVAAFPDDELGLWEAKQLIVSGRPVLVVNTGEGYKALSAVCTHLGCVVKWKKGRREFFCPCHGARFDVDGRVMGGPAPRPLPALEVAEIPGTIVVRKV